MHMLHDNGFWSRKLWLAVFTQGLILAGGVACVFSPAFAPFYATYTGSVISACALYFGANVTAKHVLGKHAVALAATVTDDDEVDVKSDAKAKDDTPQEGNG